MSGFSALPDIKFKTLNFNFGSFPVFKPLIISAGTKRPSWLVSGSSPRKPAGYALKVSFRPEDALLTLAAELFQLVFQVSHGVITSW